MINRLAHNTVSLKKSLFSKKQSILIANILDPNKHRYDYIVAK